MRYLRIRRPSRPTVFAFLMAVALLVVLLPGDLLHPLRNLGQVTVPIQLAARKATGAAGSSLEGLSSAPVAPERYAELVRGLQALENENAALRQSLEELRLTNTALAGIRQLGFPRHWALIPANVVGPDAAPGRESLLLSRGRAHHVKTGDAVASRLGLEAGSEDGVRSQAAVVARECLIGWVEEAFPWTSRAVLLSDPLAGRTTRVRIGPGGENEPDFALKGAGRGRMRIPDIPAEWVDRQARVRVGALVTVSPNDPSLPYALVIGPIVELNRSRETPLLIYEAIVEHRWDPSSLRQVFIVDMASGSRGARPAEKR